MSQPIAAFCGFSRSTNYRTVNQFKVERGPDKFHRHFQQSFGHDSN